MADVLCTLNDLRQKGEGPSRADAPIPKQVPVVRCA